MHWPVWWYSITCHPYSDISQLFRGFYRSHESRKKCRVCAQTKLFKPFTNLLSVARTHCCAFPWALSFNIYPSLAVADLLLWVHNTHRAHCPFYTHIPTCDMTAAMFNICTTNSHSGNSYWSTRAYRMTFTRTQWRARFSFQKKKLARKWMNSCFLLCVTCVWNARVVLQWGRNILLMIYTVGSRVFHTEN